MKAVTRDSAAARALARKNEYLHHMATSRAQKIIEELRDLSLDERADILAQVLPADHGQEDAAWTKELQRRVDSVISGEAETLDFEESYKRLLAQFPPK